MPEPGERATKRRTGRVEGAISRWLTKSATLQAARTLADPFRLLTLGGDALRGIEWLPGQKVQLMLGGWVQRTYTPLSWDAANGVTELLAFSHGPYPGSDWAREVEVGQACAIFGPRSSLDLNGVARPAVLFGDETSFGLAHALRFTPGGAEGVPLLLEVTEENAARAVLDSLGVSGVRLFVRQPNDAHLAEVERAVTELNQKHRPKGWVLSGKATSIARLAKLLRKLEVPRGQIQSKAYWAPGKVGLD
jgi:ferric-chelate reductase (NADPH)